MPKCSQKVRSYVQSCEKAVTSLLTDSLEFNRLRGIRKTNKKTQVFILQCWAHFYHRILHLPCMCPAYLYFCASVKFRSYFQLTG